jgi:hypothetical protein
MKRYAEGGERTRLGRFRRRTISAKDEGGQWTSAAHNGHAKGIITRLKKVKGFRKPKTNGSERIKNIKKCFPF